MAEGLAQTALLGTYIQAIQTRAEVFALIAFDRYIDLVILRGSDSLIIVTVEQRVVMHATPSLSTKSRKNSGIIVALPNPDSKLMIHSLEHGNTRRATTPTCLRHRVQEKYLLDLRVQQCHRAHNAELVRSEESETCQQVLIAVLIVRRIPSNGCQLARVGCFADDIKYRMLERVMCGRVSVTCDKELGKVVLVSVWTKYEGDDGELYW
ncbi:hypothetical protein SCLCIDRAFT_29875 [Scleroderma citrinum Foug A]|uniref:Uncharacterized protein n=1 Tax=Scleroderma citrinum Foug A TaxID=1036808 RepID=A0A0C3DJ34_9AGAM|nr:hypothetical protein SCLCIDRAFT_29875 [Scleroderma citrinum Foug A]